MNPLVSVVVTTFNHAPYIEQALESVFSQTYPNVEVIVVDDGSSDETPARLAHFQGKIISIRQQNQGIAASRNTGVHRSTGEFVAFLDGDDLWEPEKLAMQVAAAQIYPRSGLIVVDGVHFDSTGILAQSLLDSPHVTGFLASTKGVYVTGSCYNLLLEENFISTSSEVMVPTRVLRAVGASDTRFRVSSDYDLYLRIAASYDVTIVKRALTKWRYLPTSASGPRDLRFLIWAEEDIEVWKKQLRYASEQYQSLIAHQIRKRQLAMAQRAYHYGRKTDRGWASRYLLRLIMRNRSSPVILPFLVGLWFPERLVHRVARIQDRVLGLKF
jgi:cellulose synthase/poly-beta-1,6-N-acetylglucosamine synthase-like glycosyltransferase